MVFGMATAKITITLPQEQLNEIHALLDAGKADSVSGFVQHAVSIALHDAAGWRELLNEALEQTGGPLTKQERQWADRVLAEPPPSKASKKGHAA
jgi:Arc/MetJ-type ribon-helix-helix transcriptional regulator